MQYHKNLSVLWHENCHNELAHVGMLSMERSDFGVPDPEIPASTPGDVKYLGIPKKRLRKCKLYLMQSFSTGFAFTRNSCNRAAAHFCIFPFTPKIIVWDSENTWLLASVCSSTLLLVLSLFYMSSPLICNHVQTCSNGLKGLK